MTFWTNWTITVLSWLGTYLAYHFGFVDYVLATDQTYIATFIFVLFHISNFYLLFKSWQVKTGLYFESDRYGPLWFTSDAMLSLGMVGTLIGFIVVLSSAFGSIDVANPAELKQVIASLATGMGTALVTTLVGLVHSIVLKVQLVQLEEGNAEAATNERL